MVSCPAKCLPNPSSFTSITHYINTVQVVIPLVTHQFVDTIFQLVYHNLHDRVRHDRCHCKLVFAANEKKKGPRKGGVKLLGPISSFHRHFHFVCGQ